MQSFNAKFAAVDMISSIASVGREENLDIRKESKHLALSTLFDVRKVL